MIRLLAVSPQLIDKIGTLINLVPFVPFVDVLESCSLSSPSPPPTFADYPLPFSFCSPMFFPFLAFPFSGLDFPKGHHCPQLKHTVAAYSEVFAVSPGVHTCNSIHCTFPFLILPKPLPFPIVPKSMSARHVKCITIQLFALRFTDSYVDDTSLTSSTKCFSFGMASMSYNLCLVSVLLVLPHQSFRRLDRAAHV